MGLIEHLWRVPSFRVAAKDLLRLSEQQLADVARLTEMGFEVPPKRAHELGLNEEEFGRALAALGTLYDASDRGTTREGVLEELSTLMKETEEFRDVDLSEGKRGQLLELLGPRPDYDRQRELEAIQHSVLPTLEAFQLAVDLRVAGVESGKMRLVPVMLARLIFDEAVQSGDAVTFQLSEGDLQAIQGEIDRIRAVTDQLRGELPQLEG